MIAHAHGESAAQEHAIILELVEVMGRKLKRIGVRGVVAVYQLCEAEVLRAALGQLDGEYASFVLSRLRRPRLQLVKP